jgi:hypothetical protein
MENDADFIPTRSIDIENNTSFDIYCVVSRTEIDKKNNYIFHIYEKRDFESKFENNIIPDEIKNFPSFKLLQKDKVLGRF